MPVFGKDSKKKELVANLGDIYARIEKEQQIPAGDFPELRKMQVGAGAGLRAPSWGRSVWGWG